MTTQESVSKLWNLCNVLRDDGITYHQYVTELTYILFLKMAKETGAENKFAEGITLLDEETCSRIFSDFMETMDAESQEDESDADSRIDLDGMSLDALEALRDDIDQEIAERNAEAA